MQIKREWFFCGLYKEKNFYYKIWWGEWRTYMKKDLECLFCYRVK